MTPKEKIELLEALPGLGDRIRELARQGVGQKDIAKVAGVSPSWVSTLGRPSYSPQPTEKAAAVVAAVEQWEEVVASGGTLAGAGSRDTERESLLERYQEVCEETALPSIRGSLEYFVLGLASEAGEVAGVLKKVIRDSPLLAAASEEQRAAALRPVLEKELGDVLWYVANLARLLGLSLEDVIKENIEKVQDRTQRGVVGGSGDDR